MTTVGVLQTESEESPKQSYIFGGIKRQRTIK